MKRLLTLLIAVGSVGALNAQDSREEARRIILGEPSGSRGSGGTANRGGRDIILGGGGNNDSRTYPSGNRSGDVNRDYETKVNSIRNNPHLSRAEKERMIRQLDNDRARKHRSDNGRKDGYGYGRDKAYKSNNGKHKGWTKGKGNQKKYKHRYDD